MPAFSKSDKYRRIKDTKLASKLEDLCEGCPSEFLDFMNHCRNLEFETIPDYQYLGDLMNKLAEKEGFDFGTCKEFDWVSKGLLFQ